MNTTNRYSSEFKQRAVRLVGAGRQDNESEWAAILTSLDQLFLVVFTEEMYLSVAIVAKCLGQIRLTKPSCIDRVFFLAPYEPNRNNVVIRARKYPPDERGECARFPAFKVRWH